MEERTQLSVLPGLAVECFDCGTDNGDGLRFCRPCAVELRGASATGLVVTRWVRSAPSTLLGLGNGG